jgi:hypothetical protein
MLPGHHVMSRQEKKDVVLGIKEALAKEFLDLDTNHDGFLDSAERDSENDSSAQKQALRRGDTNSADKVSLDDYFISKNPHFTDDQESYIKFLTSDILDA